MLASLNVPSGIFAEDVGLPAPLQAVRENSTVPVGHLDANEDQAVRRHRADQGDDGRRRRGSQVQAQRGDGEGERSDQEV